MISARKSDGPCITDIGRCASLRARGWAVIAALVTVLVLVGKRQKTPTAGSGGAFRADGHFPRVTLDASAFPIQQRESDTVIPGGVPDVTRCRSRDRR
jgi:hypothetical protein